MKVGTPLSEDALLLKIDYFLVCKYSIHKACLPRVLNNKCGETLKKIPSRLSQMEASTEKYAILDAKNKYSIRITHEFVGDNSFTVMSPNNPNEEIEMSKQLVSCTKLG